MIEALITSIFVTVLVMGGIVTGLLCFGQYGLTKAASAFGECITAKNPARYCKTQAWALSKIS